VALESSAEAESPAATTPPPTVAAASPAAWRRWALALLGPGQQVLASLGLVLAAGLALGLVAIGLFYDLAEEVVKQDTAALDQTVWQTLQLHATPTLDAVAIALSWMGAEGLTTVLVLALVGLIWQRRFGAAVALLVTVIGAQVLDSALKLAFVRERPIAVIAALPGQGWSFPSGHAMVSLATYGFLAYLGWRLFHGRWRVIWVGALALLVVLIGLSRLYLGVHYATDVLAGYLAGFIWLDSVIIGGRVLQRRIGRPAGGQRVSVKCAHGGHPGEADQR
jgi:membrane-associated phospholipid phosphatase